MNTFPSIFTGRLHATNIAADRAFFFLNKTMFYDNDGSMDWIFDDETL